MTTRRLSLNTRNTSAETDVVLVEWNLETEIVSDLQEKANVLSEYFISVFTKEQTEDIPLSPGDSLPSIPPLDGSVKLLQDLNSNKASGPDNIPVRILKECSEQIAPFLQAMLTQNGKRFFITPFSKKGDRSLNHRPVSFNDTGRWCNGNDQTSVCFKLMEIIVFNQPLWELWYPNWSPTRIPSTTILRITALGNSWWLTHSYRPRKPSRCCSLRFSKGFRHRIALTTFVKVRSCWNTRLNIQVGSSLSH